MGRYHAKFRRQASHLLPHLCLASARVCGVVVDDGDGTGGGRGGSGGSGGTTSPPLTTDVTGSEGPGACGCGTTRGLGLACPSLPKVMTAVVCAVGGTVW